MIDKSFVEKIEQMALPPSIAPGGLEYFRKGYYEPAAPPPACALTVHTLDALVEFVRGGFHARMGQGLERPVVHVVAPDRVEVVREHLDAYGQRDVYAVAACLQDSFPFGNFLEVERFNIMLQALFVPDAARAAVLQVTGNVMETATRETSDDGCTQNVVVRQGVARRAETVVPNPVELAPYRTFVEVEQPRSRFVLRLKGGESPTAALFEADGGAWRNEAVRRVRDYLVAAGLEQVLA